MIYRKERCRYYVCSIACMMVVVQKQQVMMMIRCRYSTYPQKEGGLLYIWEGLCTYCMYDRLVRESFGISLASHDDGQMYVQHISIEGRWATIHTYIQLCERDFVRLVCMMVVVEIAGHDDGQMQVQHILTYDGCRYVLQQSNLLFSIIRHY